MSSGFDSPNYNPRYGLKNTGKVREEDFSIDGRSWNYRDPQNADHIRRQRSGWTGRGMDPGRISKKSYEIANPLYDYDYGVVRDAAKELGINNVDEQKEVDDILDYVRGNYKSKSEPKEEKEEKTYEPITTRPNDQKPQEVQDAQQEYEDTKLNKPGNTAPRMSGIIKMDAAGNPISNPMLDAITHGDDQNDWYSKKFVPHLEAEANATAHEVGDTSRFFLDNWAFEPPKLGDPKEVFKYYSDQIKGDS